MTIISTKPHFEFRAAHSSKSSKRIMVTPSALCLGESGLIRNAYVCIPQSQSSFFMRSIVVISRNVFFTLPSAALFLTASASDTGVSSRLLILRICVSAVPGFAVRRVKIKKAGAGGGTKACGEELPARTHDDRRPASPHSAHFLPDIICSSLLLFFHRE